SFRRRAMEYARAPAMTAATIRESKAASTTAGRTTEVSRSEGASRRVTTKSKKIVVGMRIARNASRSFAKTRLATRCLEAISCTTDGAQVDRVFRVLLDLLPQLAHVDIDRARSHELRVAPDGVEDLVAREDLSRVTGEEIEQAELRRRRGHRMIAHHDDHR